MSTERGTVHLWFERADSLVLKALPAWIVLVVTIHLKKHSIFDDSDYSLIVISSARQGVIRPSLCVQYKCLQLQFKKGLNSETKKEVRPNTLNCFLFHVFRNVFLNCSWYVCSFHIMVWRRDDFGIFFGGINLWNPLDNQYQNVKIECQEMQYGRLQ